MQAKGSPIGSRRSRRMAGWHAIALLGLLLLAALPGRAVAAVIPDPGIDLSVFCRIGFVNDCVPGAEEASDGAFSPLDFGVALWNGTAATLEAPSLAPIPLPAAGWLLLAGLGVLGLVQRRRQARQGALSMHAPRSHGAVLRLGGRTDLLDTAGGLRRRPVRAHCVFADPFGPAAPGPAVRVFAPGEASPVRPCGGAGHRYAATAERAPPAPDAAVCRNDDGVLTTMFPFKPPRLTVSPPVAWRFPFESRLRGAGIGVVPAAG
jgi:hypothetical protein